MVLMKVVQASTSLMLTTAPLLSLSQDTKVTIELVRDSSVRFRLIMLARSSGLVREGHHTSVNLFRRAGESSFLP